MHEVGHNRGAVQPAAPDSTGSGAHCNEGHDVMCYAPDGGDQNQSMVYPCSTLTRFDCNFDTYFDAAPEAGEWLSNHWNLGRQGQNFMVISPAGPPPNQAPTADFSADCNELACAFTDESIDPDGSIASRSWSFGDGGSSTAADPQHIFGSTGSYTVVLTVTDDDGMTDSHSQAVTFSDPVADTTPPETQITRAPAKTTLGHRASFRFTGSDEVTTTAELDYLCSRDGSGFEPCTSPARLSGFGYGRHTFRVSAVDAAGNADQSPAEHSWTRKRR
jgi:hypothetical protein